MSTEENPRGNRRIKLTGHGKVVHDLEIPADLDRWHPNDITAWGTEQEEDEMLTAADVQRARKAVSVALGVE